MGLGCSFGLSLGEWGGYILPLGACGFLVSGGGALVATVCRDMGILGFFLVSCRSEKKDKTGLHFLGFWGASGFSFPWGSHWVALLSCGHGDGASFILGFGMVLGWWGPGVGLGSSGNLGI